MRLAHRLLLAAACVIAITASGVAGDARPLKIGVTLHPYFSWTSNIVMGVPGASVVGVIPGDVDAGNYQPAAADVARLADLDAIVVNGVGHDDFILAMLTASGNRKVAIIRPNETTPLLRSASGSVNSHTFISFSNAIGQTYAIEKRLSELRPEHAAAFRTNAAAYARRLRAIKAATAARLAGARTSRVVTVHDGYGYLLQEFGIDVAAVVEPAHGLVPSARELQDMVQLLRQQQIRVLLSEASFPEKLLGVLRTEAQVRVYTISHVATGAYTADKFEREMQQNADALVRALVTD
jgi:zinc transport system substrate-binding protein